MNWDEKAEDFAGAHHTYEHRSPEDNRLIEKGIVHGARWQREQLRTDEAVARLANCLHRLDHGDTLDHHDAVCERDRGGCDRRELYTEDASAAINALLGED